jgi:hypothetical protein
MPSMTLAQSRQAVWLGNSAGVSRFWMLYALTAVTGSFHVPGDTAREALLPVLARRGGVPLARVEVNVITPQKGGYSSTVLIAMSAHELHSEIKQFRLLSRNYCQPNFC